MKKYWNEDIVKILVCIVLVAVAFFIKLPLLKKTLFIVSYIIISYEMYINTIRNLKDKIIFDENFLMILSTLGAFYIGSDIEAVLVMLLYQIGEYLSDLAVDKSKDSITSLLDLRVEEVELEDKGKTKVEEVKVGDVFLVKPGERIALDGVVVEGESYLDTSSLTGESVPKMVKKNDTVLSGCINQNSILKVKATETSKTTTSQRIMDLIENAEEKKSKTDTFIQKFAKIYTPIVCLLALLIVIIPVSLGEEFKDWLYRGLVFLVTSCPCALVISVPLGYFCGIGKCSKEGILVKGAKELDSLTNIKTIFLDKTGTITEGVFEVVDIHTDMDHEEFLKVMASAEANSIHPIAKAIGKCFGESVDKIKDYQEVSGKGITCKIGNTEIIVGNDTFLKENNITIEETKKKGTIVHLAMDKVYKGYLVISDKIKESSKKLKDYHEEEMIILSGDNPVLVESVAKELGIQTSYGNLLPEDKVDIIKKYKKKGNTLFVGDGINDAPVLKIADVGISMGSLGSDAAIEASDIVLMREDLTKVKEAILIAKKTKRKVTESIALALLVKFVVLVLAAFGKSTILLAVIADVGVTLLAIINVLMIYFYKYK